MSEEKHTPLSDTIHNLKVVREALEAEGLTVHVKLIDQAIEDISSPPQAVLGPVAWLYETWCGEDHWSQRYSDTKPSNDSWIRNVRPLYLGAPHPQAESAQSVNAHSMLVKALKDILKANDDFRVGMPDGWEGDPLQDACEAARRLLTAVGGVPK